MLLVKDMIEMKIVPFIIKTKLVLATKKWTIR